MSVYDRLIEVAEAAKPFAGGTAITTANHVRAIKEMEDLVFAIAMARKAGAIGYDIEQAVGGRVSAYLKEEENDE